MDKTNKQEELRSAIENLVEDTMMLLKTVEVKRDEVSEGVTAQIQELSSIIKSLEKENVSLQSLPKKVAVTVQELIPGIADQLHTLNQVDLALVFGTVKLIKLKGKQNAKTNKVYIRI